MRTYTFAFLAVAIIAGCLTFSNLGVGVSNVAKAVYFIFMLLVAASVLLEPEDIETLRGPSVPVTPLRKATLDPSSRAPLPTAQARTGIKPR